jgi:hypothetical protein
LEKALEANSGETYEGRRPLCRWLARGGRILGYRRVAGGRIVGLTWVGGQVADSLNLDKNLSGMLLEYYTDWRSNTEGEPIMI